MSPTGKDGDVFMTNTPHVSSVFLQEANDRSQTARRIVSVFSHATPALASSWQQIHSALSDTPVLTAEIRHLHDELGSARLERANMAAAGRATLTSHRNGDRDPLSYLRDELTAQGFWRECP
jgi:ABC-type transporter Mla subunit MlaD